MMLPDTVAEYMLRPRFRLDVRLFSKCVPAARLGVYLLLVQEAPVPA